MSTSIDRSDLALAYDRNWIPVCLGCGFVGGAALAEDPDTKKALLLASAASLGIWYYVTLLEDTDAQTP